MMRKLVILCSLMIVFACSKNKENDQENLDIKLTEQIALLDGGSLFADALANSDFNLEDEEVTIFIPSDAALSNFLAQFEVNNFEELKGLIGSEHYNAWLGSHLIPQAAKFENIHSAFVPTLAQNTKDYPVYHHIWREKSLLRINAHNIGIVRKDLVLGDSYGQQIDAVLNPATLSKLVKSHSSSFSILDRALQLTNLVALLNSDQERFTLFAPNDNAFDLYFQSMGVGDLDGYVSTYGVAALRDLIKAHLITGTHLLHNISGQAMSSQLQNVGLNIHLSNGNLIVSRNASNYTKEAQVLITDITAYNGSLNIIDEVLNLP